MTGQHGTKKNKQDGTRLDDTGQDRIEQDGTINTSKIVNIRVTQNVTGIKHKLGHCAHLKLQNTLSISSQDFTNTKRD